MKYYLHDSNSFHDEKVSELFMKFGFEGVGLFYCILEKIASQEKPIKTSVLKKQLFVGKKLQKVWAFLEEIDLISSNNGETFNERILSYSEKYQIKKEKTRERVAKFREQQFENEQVPESVTPTVTDGKQGSNAPKVKESKVKEINIPFETFWDLYNKKYDRKKCLSIWGKVTNTERQEIIQVLPNYLAMTPNVTYRKNPLTFLNGRLWEDEALKVPNESVRSLTIIRAESIDDEGYVVYESGPRMPANWNDYQDYLQGKKQLSHFDRKVS